MENYFWLDLYEGHLSITEQPHTTHTTANGLIDMNYVEAREGRLTDDSKAHVPQPVRFRMGWRTCLMECIWGLILGTNSRNGFDPVTYKHT